MIDSTPGSGPGRDQAEPPDPDPFVAEVRATRAKIALEADYDLGRIVAEMRRIEAEERSGGRTVIAAGSNVPNPAE